MVIEAITRAEYDAVYAGLFQIERFRFRRGPPVHGFDIIFRCVKAGLGDIAIDPALKLVTEGVNRIEVFRQIVREADFMTVRTQGASVQFDAVQRQGAKVDGMTAGAPER